MLEKAIIHNSCLYSVRCSRRQQMCALLTLAHLTLGSGKYTWVNGRVYDGGWMDNVMHGLGIESDQGTRYAVEVCMHMQIDRW